MARASASPQQLSEFERADAIIRDGRRLIRAV
jgi:hypothetical protein